MMLRLDKAAILAYVAAVAGTPDAAIGVRIGPNGAIYPYGGTLSPAALELAQKIRPASGGPTSVAPVGSSVKVTP